MKAISYSLFGYGKPKADNCFSFNSYLEGLAVNLRINRLLYPGWDNYLVTDKPTAEKFAGLFAAYNWADALEAEVKETAPLCEAMLWRLLPAFDVEEDGIGSHYSHFICRDLDSVATYREAQAVQQWVDSEAGAHAITDSISHSIAMMGGMIGFTPQSFRERVRAESFEELLAKYKLDFSRKGSDQDFLNRVVYPRYAKKGEESIIQHYFKGYSQTWLHGFTRCDCWLYADATGHKGDCPLNIDLGLDIDPHDANCISEHIGAAGFNHLQTMNLIRKYNDRFEDLIEAEQAHPEIFSWLWT